MNGLQYGKYTFTCRLDAPAILPEYKGSTFRGVFGLALKKVVCALRQQECPECILRHRCLYTQVFETPLALSKPDELRVTVPPHPFVLQPPEIQKMEYGKGDELDVNLIMFGAVNESLPYFIYAFQQGGDIGIGKKVNGKRAGFILEQVRSGSRIIFSDRDDRISMDYPPDILKITDDIYSSDIVFRLKVTLDTPLRLKFQNHINADLPFHVLIRSALRRISSLFTCYAGEEPNIDYKGLLDRASEIQIIDNQLGWYDWERYSNRQKKRMMLGGMTGAIVYEGRLAEYLALLEACSLLHLGKNTSFGLGKFSMAIMG